MPSASFAYRIRAASDPDGMTLKTGVFQAGFLVCGGLSIERDFLIKSRENGVIPSGGAGGLDVKGIQADGHSENCRQVRQVGDVIRAAVWRAWECYSLYLYRRYFTF